ncbi:MAG TPA: hypothetical protein VN366_09935 [Feifaniaceae bacterium]|nr:hypothetical protein [Feifaniaceae bacterium]
MKSASIEPPPVFWKYYDLYSRNIITLLEFSKMPGLSAESLLLYLDMQSEIGLRDEP